MSWEDFLSDRAHHNLYISSIVYMPAIKLIRRFVKPGADILEAGSGSGRTAVLMADMGYKVTALDIVYPLLKSLAPVSEFTGNLCLVNGDISSFPFKDKSYNIVYSFGVLEHFDTDKIIEILKEQRRVAEYVLVDVPNDKCKAQCFGDERFYSDEIWHKMFEEAGLTVKKSIRRGLDNGKIVNNCSVFLAADKEDKREIKEFIDVYDHY